MNISDQMRRIQLRDEIQSQCMGSVEDKIDRYLEIEHQGIIGGHHFASASSECIYLYRDGYFIATVMMSHSINEGIIRFVAERNSVKKQKADGNDKAIKELVDELQSEGMISPECANASRAIWKSYRNHVHHMNPTVAKIPFRKLARSNMKHLSMIEKEIFGFDINNGAMAPHQPKYWDFNPNGTINTYLRLE